MEEVVSKTFYATILLLKFLVPLKTTYLYRNFSNSLVLCACFMLTRKVPCIEAWSMM